MKTAVVMAVVMAVVIGMAGCAMTPAEVRDQGTAKDAAHETSPTVTAKCLVDNITELAPRFLPISREQASPPGSQEVIVRLIVETPTTAAVIKIVPSGKGSASQWRINPNMLGPDGFFQNAKGPC